MTNSLLVWVQVRVTESPPSSPLDSRRPIYHMSSYSMALKTEGVGSGGLRGREEEERGEHRGAGSRGGEVGTHRSIHSDCPCPRPPPDLAHARFPLSVFFTAAGGVYHSLVHRPWCRWFILNKLVSQKTIVAARLLDKERTGFSYVDSHTRKEVYRESDHDGVQIVLRGALIPKPEPRATLRPSTLGDPGVRAAFSSLLAETTDLTTATADTLWNRVLSIGLEHQRERAKARGARRQEILKKIKRLQDKLKGMPESRRYRRVAYTLNRYKGKLRLQIHKDTSPDQGKPA